MNETRDPAGSGLVRAELRRRVIARSPELAARCEDIAALSGRLVQAGLAPNPDIEAELEEFAGTGDLSGLDASEATLLASQRFETARKRPKRQRVARESLELGRLEYRIARAEVLARADLAFYGVLAAQARLRLLEELVSAAASSVEATRRLVSAGAASPVETTRAAVELAAAEVERSSGRRALTSARASLAASWGATSAGFGRVEGELEIEPIPLEAGAQGLLEQSPRVQWLRTELSRRRAVVELEDARAVPDVTIAAGVRRLEELDDTAFVAGVRVPFPLFDRNQGEREAARASVRSSRHETASALADLSAELVGQLEALTARAEEVAQLRESILPGARQVFEDVRQGYAQGRFRSLDVIDAQRRLSELRLREIDALRAHAEARAAIQRLTGVSEIGAPEGEKP